MSAPRLRLGALAAALAAGAATGPGAGAQVVRPAPGPPPLEDVRLAPRRAVWTGLGLALGTAGFGGVLEVSYWNGRLFRARAGVHTDPAQASGDMTEIAALVGTGRPVGRNWGAAAAGIGIVERTDTDGTSSTVPGVAADVQLISARFPHLAFAATANVNAKQSFAGFTLSLLLGRMPFGDGFTPRAPGW